MSKVICPACKQEGKEEKDFRGRRLIIDDKFPDGRKFTFTRWTCSNLNCYRYGKWICDFPF